MKTNRTIPKPPRRGNRGWVAPSECLACGKEGALSERLVPTVQIIRGEEIRCDVTKWVCSACEAAFMSPKQATESVKFAVEAYQQKHELLTAANIREARERLGISVFELASEANIGVATVKRLEAGTTVQRTGTNTLLSTILGEGGELPDYKIFLECTDFAMACVPAPTAWIDENPWNGSDPWASCPKSEPFSMAYSNELALAV